MTNTTTTRIIPWNIAEIANNYRSGLTRLGEGCTRAALDTIAKGRALLTDKGTDTLIRTAKLGLLLSMAGPSTPELTMGLATLAFELEDRAIAHPEWVQLKPFEHDGYAESELPATTAGPTTDADTFSDTGPITDEDDEGYAFPPGSFVNANHRRTLEALAL